MVLQATMLLCSMMLVLHASATEGRTGKGLAYLAGLLLGLATGAAL